MVLGGGRSDGKAEANDIYSHALSVGSVIALTLSIDGPRPLSFPKTMCSQLTCITVGCHGTKIWFCVMEWI